jgi:PhoH-like ATPase
VPVPTEQAVGNKPRLNEWNSVPDWIVRKLKGTENYGHLVLKGAKSRGPICDAVLKSGL